MKLRSRLARLDTGLQARQVRLQQDRQRAERARRILPTCTDPIEAFNLLVNQPPKVCEELLHLTPPEVLQTLYDVTMQVFGEQP